MKKRIVSLFLVLILVLGFVFLSKTLSGSDEVNYGVKSGRVSFSNEHYDITEDVLNLSNYYKVAENDNFVLMLDNNANPVINSKTTGKMFYSVCHDYPARMQSDGFRNFQNQIYLKSQNIEIVYRCMYTHRISHFLIRGQYTA